MKVQESGSGSLLGNPKHIVERERESYIHTQKQFHPTLGQIGKMTATHGEYAEEGKDGKTTHLDICGTQVEDMLLAECLLILPRGEAGGL